MDSGISPALKRKEYGAASQCATVCTLLPWQSFDNLFCHLLAEAYEGEIQEVIHTREDSGFAGVPSGFVLTIVAAKLNLLRNR